MIQKRKTVIHFWVDYIKIYKSLIRLIILKLPKFTNNFFFSLISKQLDLKNAVGYDYAIKWINILFLIGKLYEFLTVLTIKILL